VTTEDLTGPLWRGNDGRTNRVIAWFSASGDQWNVLFGYPEMHSRVVSRDEIEGWTRLDAPSAGRRTAPADERDLTGTSAHPTDPKPLASAFHTQPAWVSAEEDR